LILAVTLTAAIVGIDWGLPYNWHADEKVNLAASMIDRHTLNPNYFVNPTLHAYLVLAAVRTAYAVHPGTFVPSDIRWHILSTKRNAPNRAVTFLAYRLARLLSAVFAALLVWLLWILGRGAFDAGVGLLAAAFLSVTMGLANLAHFATPETTLFFLVLAALGSLQRLADVSRPGSDRGVSPYVVAGALIGLACSTKYTVWLLGVPFIAAHIRAQGGIKGAIRAWPYVLLAFAAAIAAFIVATPYSVLDARHFVEDMRFNWLTGAPEGTLAGQQRSWGRYMLTLGNALGWPLFVCAAAGGAMTLARIRSWTRAARPSSSSTRRGSSPSGCSTASARTTRCASSCRSFPRCCCWERPASFMRRASRRGIAAASQSRWLRCWRIRRVHGGRRSEVSARSALRGRGMDETTHRCRQHRRILCQRGLPAVLRSSNLSRPVPRRHVAIGVRR
jgi:hypothetical protein